MSISGLCEEIHRMMRHGLNPHIGMDDADHHRQYSSSTCYKMNEASQLIGDGSEKCCKEEKKAITHSNTKLQKMMLCQQVPEGTIEYTEWVSLELNAREISTITEVQLDCRTKQDDTNLQHQVLGEDAKAGQLTCSQLTLAHVQLLARATEPTNEAIFMFDKNVFILREKVAEVCTGIF